MRRITDGDWPPGFQLPSEAELCREFGTSRGPIRQALAFLRSEGAVTGGTGAPSHGSLFCAVAVVLHVQLVH